MVIDVAELIEPGFRKREAIFLNNICKLHEQAEKDGDTLRFYYLGYCLIACMLELRAN